MSLETFVGADVADYTAIGIVMGDLLNGIGEAIHYHTVIAHIVLNVIVDAGDGVRIEGDVAAIELERLGMIYTKD